MLSQKPEKEGDDIYEKNYKKLLKSANYLLFKHSDAVHFYGNSKFQKIKDKKDAGVLLVRQVQEILKCNKSDNYTPLPFKSNRKIKTLHEKKELEKMKGSIVALRRLEYARFHNNRKKVPKQKVVFIQRYWRKHFLFYIYPKIIRLQRNIIIFLKKLTKRRMLTFDQSGFGLNCQLGKKEIGVQADIKLPRPMTLQALYIKNVLKVIAKNAKSTSGLRTVPQLKLIKSIDFKANIKNFSTSYTLLDSQKGSEFSIFNTEKNIGKNTKDNSVSMTNLLTADTTTRSLRRDMSFLSRKCFKLKKNTTPTFITKKNYTHKNLIEIDKKIQKLQKFIRQKIYINYEPSLSKCKVLYNNSDCLPKWLSNISIKSTRKVYMGRTNTEVPCKKRQKILSKQMIYSKINLKKSNINIGIKTLTINKFIKRQNLELDIETKEKTFKQFALIFSNWLKNKSFFSAGDYVFNILHKSYIDFLNCHPELKTEQQTNLLFKNLDVPKPPKGNNSVNEKSISKLKGDKVQEIAEFNDNCIEDIKCNIDYNHIVKSKAIPNKISEHHEKDYQKEDTTKEEKENSEIEKIRELNLKMVKKCKKNIPNALFIDDIDDYIFQSFTGRLKSKSVDKTLLTSYINSLFNEKRKKLEKTKNQNTAATVPTSTIDNTQTIYNTTITNNNIKQIKNEDLYLYQTIYSARLSNPLYVHNRRNKSKPPKVNILLRDDDREKMI